MTVVQLNTNNSQPSQELPDVLRKAKAEAESAAEDGVSAVCLGCKIEKVQDQNRENP